MITFHHGVSLVLGSASPRRRELLERAGLQFEVRPADIDETPHDYETPGEYVRRLSLEKAAAVIGPNEIVVAADTTVEVDGRVLEKPVDDADAAAMLRCCPIGITMSTPACRSAAIRSSRVSS